MVDAVKCVSIKFGFDRKISDVESELQAWITAQGITGANYQVILEGAKFYIFAFY